MVSESTAKETHLVIQGLDGIPSINCGEAKFVLIVGS